MKKYLMLSAVLFGFSSWVNAQNFIEFLESKHDFGVVEEEGGSIEYGFQFVNKSSTPITIDDVNASCGCTTPGWTEEAVMPGDTGVVLASYDPFNRPGKFEKTLTVFYKDPLGNDKNDVLTIEGMVNPKPKSIEDELPVKIGSLRFRYKSLNIGKITTEKTVVQEFQVYNDGDSAIVWLKNEMKIPDHLKVSFTADTILPNSMGLIQISYDPKKRDDLGFVNDNLQLVTNETDEAIKDLNVIATIMEYFPPMTEKELEKAPKLVFDKTQGDLGEVTLGNSVITSFTLTNTGKKDLLIRKIKPNCGCTITKLEKTKIKSGDTISLEVTFDSSGLKGRQYKTITVFSNDPTAPAQMLTLKALVTE